MRWFLMTTMSVAQRGRMQRQREYWSGRYREDPDLFGSDESEFAHWALDIIGVEPVGRKLLELGAGNGRDMRFFHSAGFQVEGVDCAGDEPARARAGAITSNIQCKDVFDFLHDHEGESADVIYSNLFYNMDFTEADHHALFAEAGRILKPGGFHLYSVRTVKDNWYGRGKKVRRDTYDSTPDGTVMHFFSEAYANRLRRGSFTLITMEERLKGKGDFPIDVYYVAERKP